MPDYKNGKIYKVVDNTNGNIYYGSTTQKYLSMRLSGHKNEIKHQPTNSINQILINGDYTILLVELFPCNSKDELCSREQHFIETFECINKRNAKSNRDILNQQYKNHHYKYKEKRNGKAKEWKLKNNYKKTQQRIQQYVLSWGGDLRAFNNNLLKIDLSIYLE